LTADWINIGTSPGFDYLQYAGMAIGLVFIAYGLQKIRTKNKSK